MKLAYKCRLNQTRTGGEQKLPLKCVNASILHMGGYHDENFKTLLFNFAGRLKKDQKRPDIQIPTFELLNRGCCVNVYESSRTHEASLWCDICNICNHNKFTKTEEKEARKVD